jgi:hypothetical protein
VKFFPELLVLFLLLLGVPSDLFLSHFPIKTVY